MRNKVANGAEFAEELLVAGRQHGGMMRIESRHSESGAGWIEVDAFCRREHDVARGVVVDPFFAALPAAALTA